MSGPLDRLDHILSDLPAKLADARRQATELAARQFTAESGDGTVSATVDGSGRLVALGFPATAMRRMDNLTLGERAAEAINTALDQVESARDELVAAHLPVDDVAGHEDLFAYRLDELHRTLDSIDSRLRDLTG